MIEIQKRKKDMNYKMMLFLIFGSVLLGVVLVVNIIGLQIPNHILWCTLFLALLNIIAIVLFDFWKRLFSRVCGIFKSAYSSLKSKVCQHICTLSQRIILNNIETDNLDLLSPTDSADLQYVNMLKKAVEDVNVRNIAISGAYGSGKSSIIKTFQKIYPEYKSLNLSLANFAEEHEVETKKTVVEEGNEPVKTTVEYNPDTSIDINKLEYSLVQQFFYHVKNSDVPSSRYGRIKRLTRTRRLLYTISLLLLIAALLLLIKPSFLELGGLIKVDSIPDWLYKGSFVYCVISTAIFLYKIISIAYKLNSAKVKAVNYEIELQKDLDVSILNRYLDELVYMFQVTDYNVVVLEDLDRFERTSIFTKLRELNLLLNQAKDINRRVVFIYALKDEVFEDYHERTKFFDIIISVLPVVNSSNSAAMFMQKLEAEIRTSEDEKGLDRDVVMDLAPFIDDMRSIKSIVTDFKLFKHFLHNGVQMNNLLALLVYKTKYPADYEDLYEGGGKIAKVVSKKKDLVANEVARLQSEIQEIDAKLENVKKEYLRNVEELNAIVVAAFFKSLPNGTQWGINGKTVDNSKLYKDDSVSHILNGEGATVSHNSYYGPQFHNIQVSSIKSNLPTNFDYLKRKENLSSSKQEQINDLKNQRRLLQEQITHLNQKTIKEICAEDSKAIEVIAECKDDKLLKLLFTKGYIDENYQFYITIPTEGVLTKSDNDYLINLKSKNEIDDPFAENINSPESLLHYLTDADFESDSILNYDLVNFIFSNKEHPKEQYQDKKELILKKLMENSFETLDFINRYAFSSSVSDGLLVDICEINPELWDCFMEEDSFSNEARLNLFEQIIKYVPIDSIVAMNGKEYLSEYLAMQYYTDIFDGVPRKKAESIILKLNPIFESIQNDSTEGNLIDVVYKNNLFELTVENIKTILLAYSKITEEEMESGYYSAVMKSGCSELVDIIADEIDSFASNVLCKNPSNTKESEDRLIELLNNEKISIESKRQLICISETKIKDVTLISDIEVLKALFDSDCPAVSKSNIEHYVMTLGLDDVDDRLIDYLNRNAGDFCALVKMMETSFEKPEIVCGLFSSNKTSIEIYKELLTNPVFKDDYPISDFSEIESSRVKMAITANYIPVEPSTYNLAKKIGDQVGMCLLESDADCLKTKFDKFTFTFSELLEILKSDKLTEVHNAAICKIAPEDISSEPVANFILAWYCKGENEISIEQYDKAIEIISDITSLKTYLTIAIKKGLIKDQEIFISRYLNYLGKDFQLICQPRKDFDVKRSAADAELLFALKDKLHLLRKVELQEKLISCSTRYFK